MQTRNRKFKLPPGLERHTREEISAAKHAKATASAEENRKKEQEKAERQAKQTASKKRIAQFEDQLVAEHNEKQTLRPDKLSISIASSPAAAVVAANTAQESTAAATDLPPNGDTSFIDDADTMADFARRGSANEDITAVAGGDELEDDSDYGVLPHDDVNGPPTSESEGGFGYEMGNNSSTDDVNFGMKEPEEGDDNEEYDIDDAILDVDMPGSSDEYVQASGEEEDENDEDDYEEPSAGAKRKTGSAPPSNMQRTQKKSRQSSSGHGLDMDDPVVREFLAYQKAQEKKKQKTLQSQARAATRKVSTL
ncbi:hypothetical protein BDZ89DRAFT_189941 [Hymenopellis radicata]|nr:hypothetical protein BDZ89DRAFT_189941 [Hymenopellis radicata]